MGGPAGWEDQQRPLAAAFRCADDVPQVMYMRQAGALTERAAGSEEGAATDNSSQQRHSPSSPLL